MANPFSQLLAPGLPKVPKTPRTRVVVDGKVVTDVRQLRIDDEEERERVRRDIYAAKGRAKYQAARQDPAKMAKRQAWLEANREKVRAYKKAYDADPANKARQREQKTAWARRDRIDNRERYNEAQRAYYQRNREAILARNKAKKLAAKGQS